MKRVLLVICLAAMAACSRPSGKVLFIGVDGLASWCLETALDSIPEQIPNLVGLMEKSAWTMDKRAVYQTSSAINWATIFMGVPTEMHGYNQWNSTKPAFTPYCVSEHGMPPTLFTLLQEQRPEARSVCVYDWDGIAPLLDTLAVTAYQYVPYDPVALPVPAYAAQYGAPVIEAGMPDLFFFYFADIDEAGHKYGWGAPEYYESIVRFDQALGILLDALKASPDAERTTVLLTSDHGGKPDRGHGTYDIRDFRTPLLVWGPGQPAGEMSAGLMQYDVTALLAQLLGLKIPSAWRGRY